MERVERIVVIEKRICVTCMVKGAQMYTDELCGTVSTHLGCLKKFKEAYTPLDGCLPR